jgi:hypothetical protein
MHIDSLYENKEEFLILRKVVEFDSLSQEMIITKVKNWAGSTFVNMKEVLISETKEQLVFNYISESFFVKNLGATTIVQWYFRLVIDVKDNKLRISLYDDGNVRSQYSASRQYKLSSYFGKKDVAPKTAHEGTVNVRLTCVSMVNNIISSFEKSKNDW